MNETLGSSTERSVLSSTLNNTSVLRDYLSNVITNRDSNFGMSYKQVQKKFFKEYEADLIGKESPGPAIYSPPFAFNRKHKAKSFAQEKRECPLIPRDQAQNTELGPMTYNLQDTQTAF